MRGKFHFKIQLRCTIALKVGRRSRYRMRPAYGPKLRHHRNNLPRQTAMAGDTALRSRKISYRCWREDAEKLCDLSFGPAGSWNHVLPQQSAGMGRATIRITSGGVKITISSVILFEVDQTNRQAETQGSTIEISTRQNVERFGSPMYRGAPAQCRQFGCHTCPRIAHFSAARLPAMPLRPPRRCRNPRHDFLSPPAGAGQTPIRVFAADGPMAAAPGQNASRTA
jgi:hypothetical protein